MKTINLLIICAVMALSSSCTAQQNIFKSADNIDAAVPNNVPLPTGKYFIVNAGGEAVTPLGPTAGQNVFLRSYNHGGTQQWQITRKPNTTTYTIKLAGSDAMFFQPHDMRERTAIISPSKGAANFKIVAAPDKPGYWYIKSLFYNGDAMRTFVFSPNLPTELRFEPAEASEKWLFRFEPVKE